MTDKRTWQNRLALLAALAMLAAIPGTQAMGVGDVVNEVTATATPEGVEDLGDLLIEEVPGNVTNQEDGYVWSERMATHFVVDAGQARNFISLVGVTSLFLDLETIGLAAPSMDTYVSLVLEGDEAGTETIRDLIGPDGKAVFWNVPALPGTWIIEDATGVAVSEVEIGVPACDPLAMSCLFPSSASSSSSSSNSGGSKSKSSASSETKTKQTQCEGCSDEKAKPPKPVKSETGYGTKLLQMVLSDRSDVVVEVTTCWGRETTVEVKVSGGNAKLSGTAGGSYTEKRKVCDTLRAQDFGRRERVEETYQKDTYKDGSWKVYQKARGTAYIIDSVTWSRPSCDATRCETIIVQYQSGSAGTFTRTANENKAGTFRACLKLGWTAFSVEGCLTMTATQDSTVKWSLTPPSNCPDEKCNYTIGVMGGSMRTQRGMIGFAWRNN